MNKLSYAIIALSAISLLAACTAGNSDKPEDSVRELLSDKPAEVTVIPLKTVDFEHQLVSNGKITARNVAELRFKSSEPIAEIFVSNGASVEKGQRIAALDTYALTNAVNQAKNALDRSRLEYQDVLIGQGYKIDELTAVPNDIDELARVKSGYSTAQTQYDLAVYNLQQATLTAPIGGVIANLFAKAHTIPTSDVFCHIVDTRSIEVAFTVLENELGLVHANDRISVVPFAMPGVEVEGRVSEVNPWVDSNGMVQVKASVDYHTQLVEGMNVRVNIYRKVGRQWVVPKSAVVLRSGRQVVFALHDNKAIWHYVDTGLENADSYTITGDKLKEGDMIIVSGNINLAHESPVVLTQSAEME